MNKKAMIFSVASTILLTACNSGGGDSNTNTATPLDNSETVTTSTYSGLKADTTPLQVGKFVDAPIKNIHYKTETQEGVTNENGEYKYKPGETVTFTIGDLAFPAVNADQIITPITLAGEESLESAAVINMARLLQTLDKDNNPDNGIEIPEEAHSLATTIDFTLSTNSFANNQAVKTLISNANPSRVVEKLIDTESALAHFKKQLKIYDAKTYLAVKEQADFSYEKAATANHTIYHVYENQNNSNCELNSLVISKYEFTDSNNYIKTDCDNTTTTGNYRAINGYLELSNENSEKTYFLRKVFFNHTSSYKVCDVDPIFSAYSCFTDFRAREFNNLIAAEQYIADRAQFAANNGFTENEIQDHTLTVVTDETEQCGEQLWNVESYSFTQHEYTYIACDSSIETGYYDLLDNGIIELANVNKKSFIKRTTFADGSFSICSRETLLEAQNCDDAEHATAFQNPAEALALLEEKNNVEI